MPLNRILFAALLFVSASAFAGEPVDLGNAGKAEVAMQDATNGQYIVTIRLPSGNTQKIRDEFVPFEVEGAAAAIAIMDLTGDGAEELVLRAMIPPQSGALYVYQYS